jgi:predicted amidohydrolase
MNIAENLLEELLGNNKCDIIILPELSFINYTDKYFTKQYAESLDKKDLNNSQTYKWCKKISEKYDSYVCCGLIEIEGNNLYNSLILMNKNQEIIVVYRKKKLFLVNNIECWATAGKDYMFIDTPEFGRIGFGICMDISDEMFKTNDDSTKDLAKFMYKNRVNLIIFISGVLKYNKIYPFYQQNYWYKRLVPFLNPKTIFIGVNRVGNENNNKIYCGSSVIFRYKTDKEPNIELSFDDKEEKAKIKTIELIKI